MKIGLPIVVLFILILIIVVIFWWRRKINRKGNVGLPYKIQLGGNDDDDNENEIDDLY